MINVHTNRINVTNVRRSRAHITDESEYGIAHALARSGTIANAECRRERVSATRIRITPPLGHGDAWSGASGRLSHG